jgi:hypothetical protein
MLRNNGIHNFRSPFIKGPQPSLVLDFAGTQTLDSKITFTRSSTATYTNSSGVLTSSAVDTARFDFNPSSLQSLGLLIEQSRTNILLNSLLNGTNLSTQTVTTTAVPYTLSFYGTGTIVLSGTNISTQVGTGAYPSRKVFTFTPTAGSLILTVTGTVQYAQLEVGSSSTSFIPTGASQVTRATDVATITGSNFSSWYTQGLGTIYSEADWIQTLTTFPGAYSFDDGTTNNAILSYGANTINTNSRVGGSNIFLSQSVVLTSTRTFIKNAIAYSNANYASSFAGAAPTTQASGAVPTGLTRLQIGAYNNAYLNGHIKNITYYPSVLTSAQLQALTT